MNLRLPVAVSAALLALALSAPSAFAASTTVVLSQVAFRGPTGGNDEFIQLRNISGTAQDISGWQLEGSNVNGTTINARATVPPHTVLPANTTYLFTNDHPGATPTQGGSYSAGVPGDQSYTVGFSDNGGVQLRNATGQVVDAVGSNLLSGSATAFREGAGLSFPGDNGDHDAFMRKAEGTQDTDDNVADFLTGQAPAPVACGADCAAPNPCSPTSGITPIEHVQTLGEDSACDGQTVTIRGIVTGVDDLYGSSFDAIYKGDSGIWVQEQDRLDPSSNASDAVFVAGIARPSDPTSVIGDEITVTGKVTTQFGLVEVVPPGVGSVSNPNATEVPYTPTVTVISHRNPLPAPVTIDADAAAHQDAATRPYYRALQGMRVKLLEGVANGGGTTKFRDVYVTPGHTAQRLFRQNVGTADAEPWLDQPQEIGIAPDGGAGNPQDPRLEWFSKTEVDMDLFDSVQNVVGPLTYTFSYYEIMPQLPVAGENDGEQPTVTRGPINAAYPPHAPAQPPNTLRVASFNVENYFPTDTENDGHVITKAEYDAKTDKIVMAIHDFLGDPDVIAMQEVAVFSQDGPYHGANALTGLAAALGNYTPYIAVNNDERGIAPGFLVKNGVQASNPRILGQAEPYHGTDPCDVGRLFDRAPFALDIKKGDLDITALSNHWASQSHQEACRIAEATYVRQQAKALQDQGRNVLVAGDLNDFEYSPALGALQSDSTLQDLWSKAPAGDAYSYKFDGHLQTLDHIAVTAGLASRVTDMRYIHLDNDYYERRTPDGTGVSDHDPPLVTLSLAGTSTNGDVSGTVPATLALALGGPVTLGAFQPGVGTAYIGATTATVTSSAGDAQLSVLDASADHPGHLVNGAFALAEPLQARAGTADYAPLRADNGPLTLRSWTTPVSNDQTALGFKQTVGSGEGLRTGRYGKTLTFTLSTTTP